MSLTVDFPLCVLLMDGYKLLLCIADKTPLVVEGKSDLPQAKHH
jgi:hypothetical protein